MISKNALIFVAGHRGLVGRALCTALKNEGFANFLTRTHAELDLTDQAKTERLFAENKIEAVIVAAGLVGGIQANKSQPADYMIENLAIATNTIRAAAKSESVKKLVYISSSCIYPRKITDRDLNETDMLTGELEPTNEGYAIAKIAGIKLCETYNKQYGKDFISVVPANLFGADDHFDLAQAHVIPSLLVKFHQAKKTGAAEVPIWGSGKPVRDFMHVGEAAKAIVWLMQNYSEAQPINIGTGKGTTIRELVDMVVEVTGYEGQAKYDVSKPDGAARRVLNSANLSKIGYEIDSSRETLVKSLRATYEQALERGLLG